METWSRLLFSDYPFSLQILPSVHCVKAIPLSLNQSCIEWQLEQSVGEVAVQSGRYRQYILWIIAGFPVVCKAN